MTHEEMVEYLEAVLAALQFFQPPDLYIDLHVLQALKDVIAALEPEKPLAEGWAMPERDYYVGPHTRGCDWKAKYDRQIRVYLDRAPKGSKLVTIHERKPDGDSHD